LKKSDSYDLLSVCLRILKVIHKLSHQ
jgi:hypothetical protein